MNAFLRFLLAMGKIGCIGFGGGSALIPVIEEEICKKQKLDTKENIDKDVVVASITPGALPVEMAASVGRRKFGRKGMVFAPVMMALPGTLAVILLLSILSSMQEKFLPIIQTAFVGVAAFIIYLLSKYIVNMLKEYKDKSHARLPKTLVVMTVVFFLSCGKNLYRLIGIEGTPLFAVSTIDILLVAFFCIFFSRSNYSFKNLSVMAALGTIYFLGHGKRQLISNQIVLSIAGILMLVLSIYGLLQSIRIENGKYKVDKKAIYKDVVTWTAVLLITVLLALPLSREIFLFTGKGILSALMSFGGGDAYLTIADGLFVESGMLTENQYYGQLVPIVNVLPGSILCKTLAGAGYYIGINASGSILGGILFAFAGFMCSIAASCCFFGIIYQLYDSLVSLEVFRMISRWIRPIIAGVLINIMLSLVIQCKNVAPVLGTASAATVGCMFLLLAADMLLIKKANIKPYLTLVLNLVVVFLIF